MLSFNSEKCKHLHIGRNEPDNLLLDGHQLHRVHEEKDLGVTFEDTLSFHKHISAKINQANKMFGIIRRTFRHLDQATFLPLYKGMVRSHLDFSASVYSPHHKMDIDRIEAVQRRATKQLPGLRNLTHPERLKKLKLPTLAYRRQRADMIELYKATSGLYEEGLCKFIRLRAQATDRQGHRHNNKGIFPTHSRTNMRRNSFGNRTAIVWNSLPNHVVNAPSLDSFKNRLDKLWLTQPLLYEYTEAIDPRMYRQETPQEA